VGRDQKEEAGSDSCNATRRGTTETITTRSKKEGRSMIMIKERRHLARGWAVIERNQTREEEEESSSSGENTHRLIS